MYRAVLTAAAAAALVIGGVTPAVAAPSSRLPGAPTAVQVSGSGNGAILTWSPPRSGAPVTSWRVAIRPDAGHHPRTTTETVPAGVRADRFASIRPGVTYTLSVRANGTRGHGQRVAVRYTAPRSTAVAQSLYALDASGAVTRFPTSGPGAGRTVTKAGVGFTADDIGDVYVPSADGSTLSYVPARGGAARVLATGLHLTKDLRSDVIGNVYWVDAQSGAITELPLGAALPRTLLSSAGTDWAVGRDGTVSTFTTAPSSSTGPTVGTVVTRTADGTVTTRDVGLASGQSIGYFTGIVADGQGSLYLDYRAFGGSGYNGFWSLARGSSTLVPVPAKVKYQFSATNDDSLLLGQSAGWCAAISEANPVHPCTTDHSLADLFTQDASGGTRDVAVTGGPNVPSNGYYPGAADSAGDLFVSADSGLWRIPASGGAAEQVSTTQATRLSVI